MKGGNKMKAKETAVVLIEFQNEFCKEGGKLHDGVKGEIDRQNTIPNAVKLSEGARKKGALVIHSPFVFNEKS
jgi:nicotinamidase-related amidase